MASQTLSGEPSRSPEFSLTPRVPEFTIEELVESIGFGRYQMRILLACGIPFMADSMEIFLISFITQAVQKDFGISDLALSCISASVFFGMLLGSSFFGFVSDSIGRRKTFAICMAITSSFGILSGLSPNAFVLGLTRTLCGFGVGGFHVGMTLYTEFLPMRSRAFQLTLIQSFWAIGAIVECLLAWALRGQSWRALIWASSFPSFISLFSYFFLPESPRFLMVHHRTAEAKEIFRCAASRNGLPNLLPANFSVKLPSSQKSDGSFRTQLAKLFKKGTMRRLTICLSLIWFASSFAYYGIVFLTSQLPFGKNDKYMSMLIISLSELPAYCFTFLFSYKLGRTRGMALSSFITIVTMTILAFQKRLPDNLLLGCTFVARGALAVFFALAGLFTPEAYPTVVRSTGFGLTSGFARLAGSLTPFIAISLNALSVVACAFVYVGVLTMGFISVQLLPFDTKKRHLKDGCTPVSQPLERTLV